MTPHGLGPSNDIAPLPRMPSSDPESIRRAAAALMLRAQRARHSFVDFFEFVLRDEQTQGYLKVAPHQRVLLDFIEKHDRAVVFMPPGFAKTFTATGITLNLLGRDNTTRGLFVSASMEQTEPPILMVRSYIEASSRLKLVYPELRRSQRQGESWTKNELIVDRPFGIRTPSLMGVGMDSTRLPGKRISWAVVDDFLTRENTATKAQRDKVHEWFDSTVLSRVAGERDGRVLVMNTAWHPDDLLHRLERQGWPTLRMDVLGDITVKTPKNNHLDGTTSDDRWGIDDEISSHIRVRDSGSYGAEWAILRLTAHDRDGVEDNTVPLWPSRVGHGQIAQLRRQHLPVEFNRVFRQVCRDDDTALCKIEWIEACKKKAREHGIHTMQSKPTARAKWVVIGLDLAVSPGEEHDDTAFVTFEVWEDGTRCLLEIDAGQFDGPTTVQKVISKWEQYRVRGLDPLVMVENNAAQDYIRQFTREKRKDVLISGFTTGRAKAHPDTGVPSFFIEIMNTVWLFPNDPTGECHPQVQRLLDACLYYQPSKHTDDALMAMYFAREKAKQIGIPSGGEAGRPGLGFDPLSR